MQYVYCTNDKIVTNLFDLTYIIGGLDYKDLYNQHDFFLR